MCVWEGSAREVCVGRSMCGGALCVQMCARGVMCAVGATYVCMYVCMCVCVRGVCGRCSVCTAMGRSVCWSCGGVDSVYATGISVCASENADCDRRVSFASCTCPAMACFFVLNYG